MISEPTFELSRLQEIGWSRWDPIGLAGSTPECWSEDLRGAVALVPGLAITPWEVRSDGLAVLITKLVRL